jgi:WD40 repeat protein
LRELRLRRTMLPPAEVVALGVALSRGLATLHRAGLVHRDIKPSNVVLIGGVPKLADIGLVAAASAGLTFVGTEGFVPPEGSGTPAADVYSLGKVLYELATGMDRHDWPRLPPELVRLPERRALLELNEVLVRACEPDPRRRFVDASALLDELLLLQAGKSVRRLRVAERRTARALRVAAILAVVSAVAGGGAWIEHQRAGKELARRLEAEAERDTLAREAVYAATLAQVQRAIEREDYGQARRLLEHAKPGGQTSNLPAFEWQALSLQARGDPCVIVRSHGPAIDKMALDPRGRFLAVHDEDKHVALYDVRRLSEIRRISGVQRLAGFSADGEWLFGTTVEPLAAPQRWHVTTGRPASDPPPPLAIRPLGIQGNHRMVGCIDSRPASAQRTSRPLELVVWDFEARRAVVRFPIHEDTGSEPWQYFRSALLPAGDEIALACVKGRASLARFCLTWATLGPNPKFQHQMLEKFLPSAMGVNVQPGAVAEWWAVESTTGRRLVFAPGGEKWTPAHNHWETGGVFAATALQQGGAYEFCAKNGTVLARSRNGHRRFRGHDSLITALIPAENSGQLFSSSQSGEVRAWNYLEAETPGQSRQCWDSSSAPTNVVYSPDGKWIFAPADDRSVSMLDATSLNEAARIPAIQRPLAAGESSIWGLPADAKALVQWHTSEQRIVRRMDSRELPLSHVVFSTGLRWACMLDSSGTLSLHNLESGPDIATATAAPGSFAEYSPRVLADDGSRVWSTRHSTNLVCTELPKGSLVWSATLPARVTGVCRFKGEQRIVVALENGQIQFYNEATGLLALTVPSGSAAAQTIFPSPDGSRLFAAGIEGELHVLRASTGQYLTRLPSGGTEPLHVGAAAPDSNAVAVFSKNGLLRVIPGSR